MPLDDRLDPDKIAINLKTARIGRAIVVHDRTSSTNDVAAAYARNPAHDGLVAFAEQQTAGRGRTGAVWHSAYGDSLLFSVLLIDSEVAGELLSLTCAVAIADALGRIGGHTTRIKWPNDIMLADRKLGGILVESRGRRPEDGRQKTENMGLTTAGRREATEPSSAVHIVGIGINCHQRPEAFPPELHDAATSIDAAGGTRCDRTILARRLLASLDHWLAKARGDRRSIIEQWDRLSTQRGRRVTLAYNGRRFTGNCIGVDPENGLILQLDRGGVRMFDAAHTHIVK